MPDEQRRPVRELKKNTLLPLVVPSFVFVAFPFFLCCRLSKFHLFKTFKLLKYLCTSQWYWCLHGFNLVVEADLIVAPWMVRGQETSMSHVSTKNTQYLCGSMDMQTFLSCSNQKA